MTRLTLLTREGCHLCDRMKAVIATVGERRPLSLSVVDISSDRRLEEQFGLEIPVLMLDDRVIARYRISVTDLLMRLEGSETQTG